MEEVTWKNTLHNSTLERRTNIADFAETCFNLGYPYMCWNDRIYHVFFEHPKVTWVDTNLLAEDVGKNHIPTTKGVVVLACTINSGEPAMIDYEVEYTDDQYNEGEHYEMAKELAEEDGYKAPFICFDSNEYYQVFNMGETLKNM